MFRAALSVFLFRTAVARSYLYYPSSDIWWTNETIFPESSNRTVAALSAQCDATPGCLGFNLHGWLKSGTASLAPAVVDLYLASPEPPPPPPTFLWPQPQSVSLSAGRARFVASQGFTCAQGGGGAPIPELAAACARLPGALFRHGLHPAAPGAIAGLLVTVARPQVPLDVGVNESYALSVSGDGPISISADTVWGALQGMQTLAQLLDFDFGAVAYTLPAAVAIADFPRFPYRGVMVDPARNFLPPSVLRQVIDSLALVKLNVLHVHVLDCDSFPIQVGAAPFQDLWAGAFSPRERYTAAELAALSEYGRLRAVNVIYEFDQPGHMGAMCVAHPELCPQPACSASYGGDVLDPSSPATLPAMQAVVDALVQASPASILHLGGDEVNPACWLASPSVRAWMAARNMSEGDQVYKYFVEQSNAMAVAAGKAPMRWEEVWKHFGTALHPSTIVHAWLSSQSLFEAASAGYRSVFSVDSKNFYLDYLDVQWDAVYDTDILEGLVNASSAPLILGGQMCMWGETVDAASVLSVIWPRAAAAAERLWSYNFNASTSKSWDTVIRFAQLRCALLEAGVPAPLPGVASAGDMRPAWTVGSCGGGFKALC